MSRKHRPVYRDGKLHVRRRQCATCIYFPDNRMLLAPGRVAAMEAECIRENTVIPCHTWMDTKTPAVCRGLYNTGKVAALQIADRLGVVVFDD